MSTWCSRAWPSALLVGLCALAFWVRLGALGITDLDEGLYTEAAREMALTGDIVTPRVNHRPFFEKPPLLYWLGALSIQTFGRTEFAVRFPSALAASLLVLLTSWFGRRRLGRLPGLLAGAFLALGPVMVGAGRLATTDALLTLCVAATIVCLFEARQASGSLRVSWAVSSAIAAGCGALAKGAPAIVLPVLVLALWWVFVRIRAATDPTRRHSTTVSTRSAQPFASHVILITLCLSLVLLVTLPWHLAAWHANGRVFVQEYIIRQHLQRFQGGDQSHRAPVWFFIPGFLLGFFPWSVLTAAALVERSSPTSGSSGARQTRGPQEAPSKSGTDASFFHGSECLADAEVRSLLKTWFWVTFLVFSASGSKLISYILPLYPAAALLAGDYVVRLGRSSRSPKWLVIAASAGLGILAILWLGLMWPDPTVALVNRYADRHVVLSDTVRTLLRRGGTLLAPALLGLLAAVVASWVRRPVHAAAMALAGMAAFVALVVHLGVPLLNRYTIGSLHALTRRGGRMIADRGVLIVDISAPRRPSVLYYVPDDAIRHQRVLEPQRVADLDYDRLLVQGPVLILTRSAKPPALARYATSPVDVRPDYALWRVHGPR